MAAHFGGGKMGGFIMLSSLVLSTLCVFSMSEDVALKLPSACSGLTETSGMASYLSSLTGDKSATEFCAGVSKCKQPTGSNLARFQAVSETVAAPLTNALLCLNDCSGNGLCNQGTCLCEPGFGGRDCGLNLCDHLGKCSGNGWCRADGTCTCKPGFQGPKCADFVTCGNCTGNGQCVNGKCFCNPGFKGPKCATVVECPSRCSNNGICLRGKCMCNPGYALEDCSLAVAVKPCPENCGGNAQGECRNGKCFCKPGYDGEDCSVELKCPGSCSKHGICPYGKRCLCERGWTGAGCDEQFGCPHGCSKKGVCQHGKCFCDPGFTGPDCSVAVRCPKDCSNHGMCIVGRCYCSPDYVGEDCATPAKEARRQERSKECPDNCSGHGICAAGMALLIGHKPLGNCLCESGYYGANCATPKACPAGPGGDHVGACSGRGACVAGTCKCPRGYSGAACEVADFSLLANGCIKNCSSHGDCILGSCYCSPGWTGPGCEQKLSCPKGCSGNGQCSNGRCFCDPEFSGEDCSVASSCPNDCSEHGVCVHGKCLCSPGYAGMDCSIAPSCSLHPCVHGICQAGKCLCESGYGGVNCGVPMDPYVPSSAYPTGEPHCLHDCVHGTCALIRSRLSDWPADSELHLAFSCKCERGWTGAKCDKPLFSLQHHCSRLTCLNGECLKGKCVCAPGFSGTFCEQGNSIGTGKEPAYGTKDWTEPAVCVMMTAEERKAWKEHTAQLLPHGPGDNRKKSQTGSKVLTVPKSEDVARAAMKTKATVTSASEEGKAGKTQPATVLTNSTAEKAHQEQVKAESKANANVSKTDAMGTQHKFKQVHINPSAGAAAGGGASSSVGTPTASSAASCPPECTAALGQCLRGHCVCHRGVSSSVCMAHTELAADAAAFIQESATSVRGVQEPVVRGTRLTALASAWTGSTVLMGTVGAFAFGLVVGLTIFVLHQQRKKSMALSILKDEASKSDRLDLH